MLDELRSERIKKLNLLRENGKNPYPALTKRDASIESVLKNFPELEESKNPTSIAGRVLSLREHGGILFCDLSDGTGKIQILLKKDTLF